MTPAQHSTAATDLLALTAAGGDAAALIRNAELAAVHGRLSKAAGTGGSYTTADTLLAQAQANTTPWSYALLLAQAAAYASVAA